MSVYSLFIKILSVWIGIKWGWCLLYCKGVIIDYLFVVDVFKYLSRELSRENYKIGRRLGEILGNLTHFNDDFGI